MKRYDVYPNPESTGGLTYCLEHPQGRWVQYEDHHAEIWGERWAWIVTVMAAVIWAVVGWWL